MTTISARSILASRHAANPHKRLDTLLLRYPRCIHAELMTHRMFSRNAASSRAIPVEKMIQSVLDDPFVPLHWGKNQKGMQSDEECDALVELTGLVVEHEHGERDTYRQELVQTAREGAWLKAMNEAVATARAFAKAGYHKQIVNRLIEPFMHITVLVSSTNWSNWMALRDHPDAEPHIQILARRMGDALADAKVQSLEPGQWHLPFVDVVDEHGAPSLLSGGDALDNAIKLSVARCASTSYKTVDGFDMDLERATAIYDKLYTMRPAHASPFEHQAVPDVLVPGEVGPYGEWRVEHWQKPYLSGNFGPGWVQFRKTMPDECL